MSTELKTSTVDDDTLQNDRKVCPLCLKNGVKYTCPRCNTPYCSLDCYRSEKHRDCSEGFYKDCFMEGLKDYSSDPADKQKVLDMLKRAENDPDHEEFDEGDNDDIHVRLGDLDLDSDSGEVWTKLTDMEKREFQNMASDGRLGNLVEIWTPWWSAAKPLVTEVSKNNCRKNSKLAEIPDVVADIPNISQILKSKPSSEVKYNVINVLYVYCFICRLHNGEHVSMATECVDDFIALSDVLGQGLTCVSVDEAVQSCLKRLMSRKYYEEIDGEYNVSLLKDVENIITGPNDKQPLRFILGALSEIHKLFKKANKACTKKHKQAGSTVYKEKQLAKKTKLYQLCKKCEFYLSWGQTYGMALYGLVPELQIVYSLLSAEMESVNQQKTKLEAEWGGKIKPKRKILVEELTVD